MATKTRQTEEIMQNASELKQKEVIVPSDLSSSKKSKIEDGTLVKVKSTYPGALKFCNLKNGDSTRWEDAGDVQDMTMSDLRAMKATQVAFFKNRWILILGVTDGEDSSISAADICHALGVTKFYENYIEPTDVATVCSWTVKQIPERVAMLSSGAQENLVLTLNECIKDETLDSLKKIHAFEKALGCKLYNPFEETE